MGSFGQLAARSRSIEPPVPCHPARPEKSRLFSAFFIIRLHHFEPGYGGIDRATEFTPKAFSGGTFPRRQDIDAFSIETSGNRRKSGNHRYLPASLYFRQADYAPKPVGIYPDYPASKFPPTSGNTSSGPGIFFYRRGSSDFTKKYPKNSSGIRMEGECESDPGKSIFSAGLEYTRYPVSLSGRNFIYKSRTFGLFTGKNNRSHPILFPEGPAKNYSGGNPPDTRRPASSAGPHFIRLFPLPDRFTCPFIPKGILWKNR